MLATEIAALAIDRLVGRVPQGTGLCTRRGFDVGAVGGCGSSQDDTVIESHNGVEHRAAWRRAAW